MSTIDPIQMDMNPVPTEVDMNPVPTEVDMNSSRPVRPEESVNDKKGLEPNPHDYIGDVMQEPSPEDAPVPPPDLPPESRY